MGKYIVTATDAKGKRKEVFKTPTSKTKAQKEIALWKKKDLIPKGFKNLRVKKV